MATGKKSLSSQATSAEPNAELPECFVIMPITDPDGYAKGHFRHVFEDLFVPACERAGYRAVRADQIRQTNLIHLDVLQRLLDSPVVLCDLSNRNPNVLFELGLRQAFDKPVVLLQETGTPQIFDIAPLRYTEYRPGLVYREVIEDQAAIASAITATIAAYEENQGVNSLVKILSVTRPASLPDLAEADKDPSLQIIRAELAELRQEFRHAIRVSRRHVDEDVSSSMARDLEARVVALRNRIRNEGSESAPATLARLVDLRNEAHAMHDALRQRGSPTAHAGLHRIMVLIDELEALIRDATVDATPRRVRRTSTAPPDGASDDDSKMPV